MNGLRGYQEEICRQVLRAWERHRSVMVQMPTGTGKTVVLAALVEQWLSTRSGASEEVVLVAHRRELVEQMRETVRKVAARRPAGQGLPLERLHLHSIQWLSRHEEAYVPSLVIVDEAHHALAATYRVLWQRWPQAHFLGLTATPYRLNGEGFGDLFDCLVCSWSVRRFLAEGWLSGYDYYAIRPDSEAQRLVDSLKKRGADGDFQLKEMVEKLDGVPSIRRLFDAFRQFAGARKGLVYAISIEHAEHIADFYRLQGVRAEAVSSRTPQERRKELVEALRTGALQVLVNVDLFSEGFDCPDVGFVQLARPTLSLAKYLQMVGRGLRIHEGKQPCVLLDQVGLYRLFGLPSADRDWRLYFAGWREERASLLSAGAPDGGWFPAVQLDESDGELVRIASLEQGAVPWTETEGSGFEPVRQGRRQVGWRDGRSGVVFASYPKVVDYGGIELATEDERTFFPRLASPWLNGQTGISRKSLDTQPFRGISWQRLYLPFSQPGRLFRLLKGWPCGARLYEDEQGHRWGLKDLDCELVPMEEEAQWEAFLQACEAEWQEDELRRRTRYRQKVLIPGQGIPREVFPPEAVVTEVGNDLCRVTGLGDGSAVCWVDLLTGYRHEVPPVLFQRGFVRLLREGNRVFIRNIREEMGMAYRNWQVRCDADFCTVGDSFYWADRLDWPPLRIRKRSEDFRMFVLEATAGWPEEDQAKEWTVINLPDRPVEVRVGKKK